MPVSRLTLPLLMGFASLVVPGRFVPQIHSQSPATRVASTSAQTEIDPAETESLKQRLKAEPEHRLQFENNPDCFLRIADATVKVIERRPPAPGPESNGQLISKYAADLTVFVLNGAGRPIIGVVRFEFQSPDGNCSFYAEQPFNMALRENLPLEFELMTFPQHPAGFRVRLVKATLDHWKTGNGGTRLESVEAASGTRTSDYGRIVFSGAPASGRDCGAESGQGLSIEPVAVVDAKPGLIKQTEFFHFPPAAHHHGVSGTLRLWFVIDSAGHVVRVCPASFLPDLITEEAVRYVYGFQFKPPTESGNLVSRWAKLDFSCESWPR